MQVLDMLWIQLIKRRETLPVIPEELHQPQLRQDANNICLSLFNNQHPVHATAKDLHSFRQICRMRERDKRCLRPQLFDIPERDRLSLTTPLSNLIEGGCLGFGRVCEANYEEEVCVEVAVIEGSRGGAAIR